MSAPPLVRGTSSRTLGANRLAHCAVIGPVIQPMSVVGSDQWRSYITIEERSSVRQKISEAYRKNAPSYEEVSRVRCGCF